MFSLQDLYNMFREAPDIDLKQWGREQSKTVTHLLNDVVDGEATLELLDRTIYRSIEIVSISIYSPTDTHMLLREERQIFSDGRVRIRNLPDNCSVAEKIKFLHNETPEDSTIRAISEELNITIASDQLNYTYSNHSQSLSNSYPCIITKNKIHTFKCTLTPEQYNPKGYTEIQKDKITYFKWFSTTV